MPWIFNHSADEFLQLGRPNNGGTKIFSISGDVTHPGNYEIPLGTPFSKLLELAGGMRDGKKIKAVIPGGSSMPVVPGNVMMATDMDYDSIAKAGSMLGSGAVIVMDETRCMVRCLERLAYFYFEESCGQCTPCREGTGWLYRVVHRIEHGQGRPEDIDLLNSVADNIQGRTICALGDAAAMPVRAFIKHYRSEFEHHVEHKQLRVVPRYNRGEARRFFSVNFGARRSPLLTSGRPAAPKPARLTNRTSARAMRTRASRTRATHGRNRSRRPQGAGARRQHADGGGKPPRHLRAALLLSQEAVDRCQLPHVPGRSREGAEAAARLRDSGDARNDRADSVGEGQAGPEVA